MKWILLPLAMFFGITGALAQTGNWVTTGIDSSASIDFPVQPQQQNAAAYTTFSASYNGYSYTALTVNLYIDARVLDSTAMKSVYVNYINGIKKKLPDAQVIDEKDYIYLGRPGKDYLYNVPNGHAQLWINNRVIIIGGHLYSWLITANDSAGMHTAECERFINSFSFKGTIMPNKTTSPVDVILALTGEKNGQLFKDLVKALGVLMIIGVIMLVIAIVVILRRR